MLLPQNLNMYKINSNLCIGLQDLHGKHRQSIVNYENYIWFQNYLQVLQTAKFCTCKRGKMTAGTTDKLHMMYRSIILPNTEDTYTLWEDSQMVYTA